mgnify:CR=1 FL=1
MNNTKWILGAVIVLAVLALGIYGYRLSYAPTLTPEEQVAADKTLTPTPATDVSDSAVEQDTAAIDVQLKAIDADTAAVDSGLSASAQ